MPLNHNLDFNAISRAWSIRFLVVGVQMADPLTQPPFVQQYRFGFLPFLRNAVAVSQDIVYPVKIMRYSYDKVFQRSICWAVVFRYDLLLKILP